MNNQERTAIIMAYDYLTAVAKWGDANAGDLAEILEISTGAGEAAGTLAEVFANVVPVEDEQGVV